MKARLLVALFPTVSQAPGFCLAHNRCSINICWMDKWMPVYAACFLPVCVKPERPSVAVDLSAHLFQAGRCVSFGGGRGLCLFRQSALPVLEGEALLWHTVPPLQAAPGDSQVSPLSPSAQSRPVTIFV